MSDHVTTFRWIPTHLFDKSTVGLVACEGCAFVWSISDKPDTLLWVDSLVIACPCCGGTETGPLYVDESAVKDWRADIDWPGWRERLWELQRNAPEGFPS